jgi:hypothetical protein
MKGTQVKRFRPLAIVIATAAIVGIPTLGARAQDNCVAETVRMLRTTFPGTAQATPGGVADLIAEARSNPDAFPWC